jgi:hypothetical protein
MPSAHADYLWVAEFHNGLLSQVGYCLSLVRGIPIADAVERLGGEDVGDIRDLTGLVDHAFDTQSSSDFQATSAGVIEVDGWALIFEPNGFLGVTPTVAERLARDTLLVSHSRNVNAHGRFTWWERGERQLEFDPLFSYERHGPRANDAVPMLVAAGFEVAHQPGRPLDGTLPATFALADRLTDVAVTADLLTTTGYTVVQAPLPRPSTAPRRRHSERPHRTSTRARPPAHTERRIWRWRPDRQFVLVVAAEDSRGPAAPVAAQLTLAASATKKPAPATTSPIAIADAGWSRPGARPQ